MANIKPILLVNGTEVAGVGDWNTFKDVKSNYETLRIENVYEESGQVGILFTIFNQSSDGLNRVVLLSDNLENISFPLEVDLTNVTYSDVQIVLSTNSDDAARVIIDGAVFIPTGQGGGSSKPHPDYPDGVWGALDNLMLFRASHSGSGMGEYVAPDFDEEKTYKEGEYVLNDEEVYNCLDSTGPGGFDPDKWERRYVINDLLHIDVI